jgi:hypothetical protein
MNSKREKFMRRMVVVSPPSFASMLFVGRFSGGAAVITLRMLWKNFCSDDQVV